eukprot:COSAG04_NODE_611_length_12005_cov_230.632538_12_plen_135_part_00
MNSVNRPHFLGRISPISSPFFSFFARFNRLDEAVPTSRKPEPRAKKRRRQDQEFRTPPFVRHRVCCVRLAHTHLEQCAGISSTFNKQALVVIQFAGTTQNGVSPDGFFTNPDTHEQESLCLMSNTKVWSWQASS